MITDAEKQNALILTMNIKAFGEQLERVKRLAEYCSCWISEACTGDDTQAAETDLMYLHDVVKTIEQKIKELEDEKARFLLKLVKE